MHFHFVCWSLVDSLIFVSRNASQKDKSWKLHQTLFINAIVHFLSLIIFSHKITLSPRLWGGEIFMVPLDLSITLHSCAHCHSSPIACFHTHESPQSTNFFVPFSYSFFVGEAQINISLFWHSNFLTQTHIEHTFFHIYIYISLSLSIFLILYTHMNK
jgi:hypothetical protein